MDGPPVVGFDAMFLERPMSGSGQYALNLWRRLRDAQSEFATRLLMPHNATQIVRAEVGDNAVTGPVVPKPERLRKISWEQAGLPHAAWHGGVDLVHIPYFAAPLLKLVPCIVTIHDVIPLVLPGYCGSLAMRAYVRLVSRSARSADLIITDSEHSRMDIQRELGVSLDRIRTIQLGVSDDYTPARTQEDFDSVSAVKKRYGLKRPFVLNVGGFDRRKRLRQLVAGFGMALPQLADAYDLVIVGAPHSDNQRFFPPLDPIIRRFGLERRVRMTGFVSEQDKLNLFRAAAVFAFTSSYEGFGLDPLEAMACGLPVICSNRSSLPEVVGDAGLLIEPKPRAIARALVEVLSDEKRRNEMREQSLARAACFSWDKTARETLMAYREVAIRRGLVH